MSCRAAVAVTVQTSAARWAAHWAPEPYKFLRPITGVYLPARRRRFGWPERPRTNIQHRAGGEIAADVGADLPPELLAHGFEPLAFDAFDIQHVRQIGGVHFDGKTR